MLRPSFPKNRAVRPWRAGWETVLPVPGSVRRSCTILPKVTTQAPGRSIIDQSSMRLVRMVGFSMGGRRVGSQEATAIGAEVLDALQRRYRTGGNDLACALLCIYHDIPGEILGTPCHTSSSPVRMEKGSSTRVIIRTRSL